MAVGTTALVDPTAASDWQLDLAGTQTLSADGVQAWWGSTDSATPAVSRLLGEIVAIVIRSTVSGSTLVVAGSVPRPVSFLGGGADHLVLAGPDSTVTLTAAGSGTATMSGTPITFGGVGEVSGTGPTTYSATGMAGLHSLVMDADDTFAISSATSQLRVDAAQLAGTLRVQGGRAETTDSTPFLTFGTVSGDFDSFRGLEQGAGGYLKPVLDATGYYLTPLVLPGGMTVTLPNADAADDFFAYLSGKDTPISSGTEMAIDLAGQHLTGHVTLGRSGAATSLVITDARLLLGDSAAPIATLTASQPAQLQLTDTAMTGQVVGSLTVAASGVGFEGTFAAALDSSASPTLLGADSVVVVSGVRLGGVPLALTLAQTAAGWELHLTAPTGATMSLGAANQQLLIGTLVGTLALTLTPAGAQGSLPTATVRSVVFGVNVSGSFKGQFSADGSFRLVTDDGTLGVDDTTITGAMELAPTTGTSGQPSVAITGTDLRTSAFGGLLVILGLTGGNWDLTRSGATGSASGTGSVLVDGVTGSGSATVVFNTQANAHGDDALIDNQPVDTAGRGPPVSITLTNLRVRLTPNPTLPLNPNPTPTSAAPIDVTITAADQIPGLISAALAAWQIILAPNADHMVSVATDLADIVVTIDGTTSRRAATQVIELSITASGTGANTVEYRGVAVPVIYTGGTDVDRIFGPAADTTWSVTGRGAGTLTPSAVTASNRTFATFTFSSVEQLVGAADNKDVFVFEPGGSMLLGVAGGDRGFDTLVFDGPAGPSSGPLSYTPDGPDSGTVAVGNNSVRFVGLEPVSDNSPPADVVATYTDPLDTLTVSTDAATGHVVIGSALHEEFDFAVPATSITINAGGALVNIGPLLLPTTVSLTVNTAGYLTVEGTLTAGTITLTAIGGMVVNNGQRVSASDGDLTLQVIVSTQATPTAVTPVYRDLQAIGGMQIGTNAILTSIKNVTITVDASTQRFAKYYINQLALDSVAGSLTPGMTPGSYPTFAPGANAGDPGTITRQTGDWTTEGFVANGWIRVSNSASNNGFWHLTTVTSAALTIDAATPLTAEAGDSAVTIEGGYLNSGKPALTFSRTTNGQAVTSTITRSTGSWIDDGFKFGQSALVLFTPDTNGDGAGENDGDYVVLSVTATTLTVDAGPGLQQQGPVNGVIVWTQGSPSDIPMVVVDPTKQLQNREVPLTFGNASVPGGTNQGTITRSDSGGSWISDGFAVGQFASIKAGPAGSVANDGLYQIVAITDAVLTLAEALAPGQSSTTEIVGVAAMSSPTEDRPVLTFAGSTITRSSGSWTSDGFVAGLAVTIAQTQDNNGTFRIDTISGDGLTLTVRNINGQPITLTAENTSASTVDPTAAATTALLSPELTFTGNGPTDQYIERNRGSWTDDKFAVGDIIQLTGVTAVAGMYTVSSISQNGQILNLSQPTPFTLYPQVLFGFNITVEGMLRLATPLTAGSLENATVGDLGNSKFFDLTSWLAQILSQTATATLTVENGASIAALGNLTVGSTATTSISTTTTSLIFGITKAVSNGTATVAIGNEVTLQAGGTVSVTSVVTNTMSITTSISSGLNPSTIVGAFRLIPGPAITVAIGQAASTSSTTLAAGSLVQGAGVTIGATNTNSFLTATNSVISGLAAANTGFAIAVTVGDYTSTATVEVDGTVRSNGDLSVSSSSINSSDDFDANSGVSATPYPLAGGGKMASVLNGFKGGNLFQLDGTSNSSKITASAAVAVGSSVNSAATTIGATAVLSSSGNLTVSSYAEDNFNVNATTWATLSQSEGANQADPKQGSIANVSLAGAVGVASYSNTATTTVAAGAALNAASTLSITSQAIMPIQFRIKAWVDAVKEGPQFDPEPTTSPDSDDPITNGQNVDSSATDKFTWLANQVGHLRSYLFNTLLGPFSPYTVFSMGGYFTSTAVEAQAGGTRSNDHGEQERSVFGATGTVLVLTIVNTATTAVGAGTALNTRPDAAFLVKALPAQQVNVTADSSVEMVNEAGLSSLTDLAYFIYAQGVQGKAGIGGTVQQITVTTGADAHVDDGATIKALKNVTVQSTDHTLFVVASQQLGDATEVGLVGSYTLLRHTGTSLAYLEDTVFVDAGGDLSVAAASDSLAVTFSGVMQNGGVVAVGGGVSINAFDTTTRAFIGNADGSRSTAPPPTGGTSLKVGGALTVTAHSTELLIAVGIAATAPSAGNEAATAPQPAPVGAAPALNNAGGQVGQGDAPSFGFGLSASVSVNFVSDVTQAYIDVPGAVKVTGALSITATTTTRAFAVTAGILPLKAAAKTEITLAGAFVWNEISGQKFGDSSTVGNRRITSAYLGAPAVNAESVTVQATTTELVVAVAAAIGVVLPTQKPAGGGDPTTINLAGAAVVNRVLTATVAEILSGTAITTTTGDVSVGATRRLTLTSVAGTLAIGGTVAVGAGVQYNKVDDVVYATIADGASVTAGGNILLLATAVQQIVSVAAALAVFANKIAVPITFDLQDITSDVRATTGVGVMLTAVGNVIVNAVLTAPFTVIAGSGALIKAGDTTGLTTGFGAAIGWFTGNQNVLAELGTGTTVEQALNQTSPPPAVMVNGVSVTGVYVHAEVDQTLLVLALAGAGGSGGSGTNAQLAWSPAIVELTSSASARSTGAAVTGTSVEVSSVQGPKIYTLGIAGSVALNTGSPTTAPNRGPPGPQLAGAGSGAINIITLTTEALVTGGDTGSITATSRFGGINVTATDNSFITGDAGGVAIAYSSKGATTVVFGVSLAINDVTSTVTASISGTVARAIPIATTISAVVPPLTVATTSSPAIKAYTIAGALAVGTGGNTPSTQVSLAGVGAGSRNTIAGSNTATIYRATVSISVGVTVSATDSSTIVADAGGFAIAIAESSEQGSFVSIAVGLSASVNSISRTVSATIDASSVTTSGSDGVVVEAIVSPSISALSMGGAASANAGAGAGSQNTLAITVTAAITATSGTTSINTGVGTLRVEARDTSTIEADAGGVSVALALGQKPEKVNLAGSIAASVAINRITNTVSATIDSALIFGFQPNAVAIAVLATSNATISALTLSGSAAIQTLDDDGGSLSLDLAGAGAGSGNAIDDTVTAHVTRSTLRSYGAILVQAQRPAATDGSPTIDAQAYGASFALNTGGSQTSLTATIGAAVAVNAIGKNGGDLVQALIDSSTLTSSDGITIGSQSTASIHAIAVGATIGVTVSTGDGNGSAVTLGLAGGVTLNAIASTVDASVANSTLCAGGDPDGGDFPNCGGAAVSIDAEQTGSITATVVAASVTGTISKGATVTLGASVATNNLTGATTATISGATTTITASDISVTAVGLNTITATTVAVTVGLTISTDGDKVTLNGAGAVSVNTLASTVIATVDAATVTAVTGNVIVSATSGGTPPTQNVIPAITATAVAASVTVTGSGSDDGITGNIAGAVSTNALSDTVHALIQNNATVTANAAEFSSVELVASVGSKLMISVVAVTVSVTITGSSSVSLTLTAAVATTTVQDDVQALATNARITGSMVTISATTVTPVTSSAVSVSLGFTVSQDSAVTVSAGGAVALNDTSGAITAAQASGSVLQAGNSLTISAQFGAAANQLLLSSTVTDVSISVSVGAGSRTSVTISADAAVASNTAGANVSATVTNGTQICPGTGPCAFPAQMTMSAAHLGGLSAIVTAASVQVGIGKGATVSLAAAVATNSTSATVNAAVSGNSTVRVEELTLTATLDGSLLAESTAAALGVTATAGSDGAAATLSALGAVAVNTDIGNSITASIDGSSVIALSELEMTATDGSAGRVVTTKAVAASLSVTATTSSAAVTVTLGAAVATADLGSTTTATIINTTAPVTSVLSTQLTASSLGSVVTSVGAGTVSVSISSSGSSLALTIAAAVATSTVHTDVQATVENSTIAADSFSMTAVSSVPVVGTAVAIALTVTVSDSVAASVTGAAAVVINDTTGALTQAHVNNSTVWARGGPMAISAQSGVPPGSDPTSLTATVVAVTGTVSVGTGGTAVTIGLDGAVAINRAGASTIALVDGGSHLCAGVLAGNVCTLTGSEETVSITANEQGAAKAVVVAASLVVGIGKGASISLAAAVASNTMSNGVAATVTGAGTTVLGYTVTIGAAADNSVTATTVAVSIGITITSGSGAAVTLTGAAALSFNTLTNTVIAGVDIATITAGTGGVAVTAANGSATTSITATAVAASLTLDISGTSPAVSATLDAAVTTATLTDTVHADVTNGATITSPGGVQLLASSVGAIKVAVGAGNLAGTISDAPAITLTIAAAVAQDTVSDDVRASVSASTVTGSAVTVGATSSTPVSGTAVALALSPSLSGSASIDLTGAGTSVKNEISGTTAATISGGRVTATNGALSVTAQSGATPGSDSSTMTATAASVSGTLSATDTVDVAVAIGVALGSNTWSMNTSVSVDSAADLCAGTRLATGNCSSPAGAVTISALSNESLSAGIGAGSITFGVGDVGGSVSVDVALATNTLTGSTTTTVDGSVVAGGSVAITAEGDATVSATAVAVAIGVQVAANTSATLDGAGASATNTLGGTVGATVSGGSLITAGAPDITAAGNDITVLTKALSMLDANGAGATLGVAGTLDGLAVSGTIGVGLASNTLSTSVYTEVSASTLAAQGRVAVDAISDRYSAGKDRLSATAIAVAVSVAIANPTTGGGFAASGAGTSVINTASDAIHALVDKGSRITANGNDPGNNVATTPTISVAASSVMPATSTTVGVSGSLSEGAVAIGVSLSTNTLGTTVEAAVQQATLSATAGDVAVAATRVAIANTVNVVVSIALGIGGAGGGATTTSTVSGKAVAHVDQLSSITAAGNVVVVAISTARSAADTQGGAGGVLGIAVLLSTATLSASTLATVDGSTINAGGLSVTATRNGVDGVTDTTYAHVVAGSAGFILSGSKSTSNATDSGPVAAAISNNATVTITGGVTVAATGTTSTDAVNSGGSGDIILAITIQDTSATHSADTTASVDATTTVTAGSLAVTATAGTAVTTNVFTLGVGIGAGAGAGVTATSSGAVNAYIGTAYGTTAPAAPKPIRVIGAITVTAGVEQSATVSAAGGAGGLIGIAGITATSLVSGTSRAYVGDGTVLSAGALTVQVRNTTDPTTIGAAQRTANASTTAAGVGILAGAGSNSTAVINGSLEALIGANATLVIVGATTVSAEGVATADADANGGSGGGIAISAFFATACVSSYTVTSGVATCSTPTAGTVGTRAYVGAGTMLTTGSLQVDSTGTDSATGTVLAVEISLIGGAGGDANASVDSDVQSWIGGLTGTSTTTINAAGAVAVTATATQTATATNNGGSGGGISVAWLNATSSVSSAVDAVLGDGVRIGSAGSVQLRAETVAASASATVLVGGFALITVNGATVTATSSPTVTAAIGDGVQIGSATPVAGDVTISALGRAAADATASAYAGGGIVVAPPTATVTIDPTVDAHVGTATVKTSTIQAAGSISLTARLIKDGATYSDLLGAVDLTDDTVAFTYPSVTEGTQVMYSKNGGTVLGGLHDGKLYTVLNGASGQIRFGSLFTTADVDPLTDTITFATGHGYISGDCVWYDPRGGASIIGSGAPANSGGCGASAPPTPGAHAFFVRVLSPTTIALTTTLTAAVAASDATIEVAPGADTSHLVLPSGTGVNPGDQVVYRAGFSVPFSSSLVNIDLVEQDNPDGTVTYVPKINADGSTAHNPAANNIFVGLTLSNSLSQGDALTYTLQSATGGMGLVSGTTYYVIVKSGFTISLAASYCEAVGGTFDPTCAGIAITPLALTLTGGDSIVHQLNRNLGQLIDGRTYWVNSYDPGTLSITLGATLGGPDLDLDWTHSGDDHFIGIKEVDLIAPAGSGQQALFTDLSTACASSCGRVLAASGQPLSTVNPPAGDDTSNAVAVGGTGALLDFPFPKASVTGTPTVSATVAGTLIAGLDVSVLADSTFAATAYADTASGGLISVGMAISSLDMATGGSPTTVTLAGSITAGRDLTAAVTIDHTISSTARSVGGAIIAVKIAYSYAWLNDDATVAVLTGTTLAAGRALSLTVAAADTGTNSSEAYSGSLSGAAIADDANNTNRGVRLGSSDDTVDRGIDVGAGSTLTGSTVALFAAVTSLNLTSSAKATAFAAVIVGYAEAYSNSQVDDYSNTYVQVHGPNTTITGLAGVDLRATQNGLVVSRNGYVLAVALIPPQRLSFEGADSTVTSVVVEQGVTVTAGARGSTTVLDPAGAATALFVQAQNQLLTRNFDAENTPKISWGDYTSLPVQTADIRWDADVVVLGGSNRAPQLVIGADGTVLAANDVLIGGVAPIVGSKITGPISVSPIVPSGTGNVVMQANNAIVNNTITAAPWPLFEFRTTVATVTIVNLSPFALTVAGIDVVGTPDGADPLVQLTPNTGFGSSFEQWASLQFDVRSTAGATYVDLEQRSASAQDLVIAGPINNPLGLTRLVNLNGSITRTGNGQVTTNQLDIFVPNGSVGTELAPLLVDLVRFASPGAAAGGSAGTVIEPGFVVDAAGDAFLSLRGLERADPAATSMTLNIDAVTTGGRAVLDFRTALAQPTGTTTGGDIDVQVVAEQTQWANPIPHSCHFRGQNSAVRSEYDPCAGVVNPPDPSAPVGPGIEIATAVQIAQRTTVLPRFEVTDDSGVHYAASTATTGALTLFSADAAPAGTPGITSNGLSLCDSCELAAPPDDSSPSVSLTGFINPDRGKLTPYGWLDVDVAGDITLTVTGNVTIGLVESRQGDVTLKVLGNTHDDDPPAPFADRFGLLALLPPPVIDTCDARGINVTLDSNQIGTPDNFLEVCLRNDRPTRGALTATAVTGIFITALDGDLRIRSAVVTAPDTSLVDDLSLTTADGSILDFDHDAAADVVGNRIVLVARGAGAGIGSPTDALEIDSSTVGARSGWVYANGTGVDLTETVGPMLVLGAQSDSGSVVLRTPDTTAPNLIADVDGFPYRAETIEILSAGSVLVTQGVVTTVGAPGQAEQLSGVWAGGDVLLAAGDDLRAGPGTYLSASGTVTIDIDADSVDAEGGLAVLAGHLGVAEGAFTAPASISVLGNNDPDTFEFAATFLGASTRVLGGGGADAVTVDGLQSIGGSMGEVELTVLGEAGNDRIDASGLADTTVALIGDGGDGDDLLIGGAGDDLLIGGPGADRISGGAGNDDLIGGSTVAGAVDGADVLDGGAGNDWIAGDNAEIRRGIGLASPRFRTLTGEAIYDAAGNPQIAADGLTDPDGSQERTVELFDMTGVAGTFGDDIIAGGAGDDVIFGQLGDDWIAGDSALLDRFGAPSVDLSASRPPSTIADRAGPGTDGDDYIEGNGGDDTIFGGLGQDDLIGGSSGLFGLTAAERTDGADTIYGDSGTNTGRYYLGDRSADGHARDADVIVGDNGNIFRIQFSAGVFARYAFDSYSPTLPIKVRAVQLLDYTYGGSTADLGAADMVHGEDGDDTIAGMTGNDVLFGDAGDDNVYGGAGSDRIYGGNGTDGLLGDDGIILTSRNGSTEPLNGITVAVADTIVTLDEYTQVGLTVAGELQKQARLFNWTAGGNDLIYGGLGDDFIHGGAGDDAISGAESIAEFYNDAPVLDANPLHFDPITGYFAAYDPADPRSKVAGFLLNFDAFVLDPVTGQPILDSMRSPIPLDDGLDRIFGDNGNDWLVGGTDCDVLFGGSGRDLLQLDDYLDTNTRRNDQPEELRWFAWGDLAYGGADADILIANTAQDRMYDWDGAFNQFWVPFEYYDAPVVNQHYTPEIAAFLRVVADRAGADSTLGPEPFDEPAIVTPAAGPLYHGQFAGLTGQLPPFNANGPSYNRPGVERDGFTTDRAGCRCFAIAASSPIAPVGPVLPPGSPSAPAGSVSQIGLSQLTTQDGTTGSAAGTGTLPNTGTGVTDLLPWAILLLLAGALLIAATRRQRSRSSAVPAGHRGSVSGR